MQLSRDSRPVLRALLLAACLGVGISAAAEEPILLGRRIAAIEFDCAAPLDASGLTQLMPMKVGDLLRAVDLEEARWRLTQKDIFTTISIETLPRGDAVAVVVRLVRKSLVNRVHFSGNEALSDKELTRLVRLRDSMLFSQSLEEYSVRRVHERYVAEGFEDVRVAAEVQSRDPGEVDVTFRISEGEPLRIGAIVIQGSNVLAEDAVRKASGIRVGDRYVREQLRTADKAIVRLFRDHQYDEVEVESDWERGADKRGTVRFKIDSGPLFEVMFAGNHHLSDKKLLKLIDLPKRPIVTDGTWRELARRARRAYQEAGYYFAHADLDIDPGPPKRVRFTIDEGQTFYVGGVQFEGNHGLSAGQLLAAMATRTPSWVPWRRGVLLDDALDDDMKRLWSLYRRHGFEAAQILDDRTRFDRDSGKVFITVVVDEGPQTIVQKIEHAGVEAIQESLPEFLVRVGKPLDLEAVEKDRQALLTAFAIGGYTRAKVTAEVNRIPSGMIEVATVRFDAVAGIQQRVGTIIVQKNLDTHAGVIIRELPFRSGDPLDPNALLRGQGNIYKLGIFRSVTVRPLRPESEAAPPLTPQTLEEGRSGETVLAGQGAPQPEAPASPRHPQGRPNHRDVVVTVSEKPPGNLQYGAGYNTRDGFRGFVEVSDDNLQGVARRLSLRGEFNLQPGDVTPNEYLGNLGFREPRLDGSAWSFRSNLIAQRSTRRVDQFSLERFAYIPALERTFLPGLQAGVEMQVEQAQVFDLFPDVANFNPRDQGRLRTISMGPFAIYDARDDPFVPRSGVFDSVRLRVAPAEFGSDIPLIKVFAQHVHYLPLNDDLAFVYVLRGGWADAYRNHDILPIRERFFLGGRSTVRGFGENQIGPRGNGFVDANGFHAGGDPLGGNVVLNLNTELRFPLFYGFGGVVFVDGGGVYLPDQTGTPNSCSGCGSLSIHDFRRSAGLGLRYITPVGPVSLDYGFKLDRRSDESIGEVHFSVGTIF